jgi:hypothetical protein
LRITEYIIALLPAIAACNFDGQVANPAVVDPLAPDAAADADSSGPGPDAPIGEALHLLLSEVKNTIAGTEFIEIYNPTASGIALDDYYLADNPSYPYVPTALLPGPKPPVANSDFIARFPAGTSIAPGAVLVIGINPSIFSATFGFDPDFKIGNSGGGTDMENAFPSSVGSMSSLTDGGEGVALFYWDGASDLVTDVDLVIVGPAPAGDNNLVNKTGLSIDGPDIGEIESSYKPDLSTMDPFERSTVVLESFERIAPESGHETQAGTGNGRFGHDETTEDTSQTWAIITSATPGVVAASL